ncbi:pilus assembly protein TadB [Vibrio albus]|uniref:Pilus assembly protein TadB n=1 Tax=Vibrio albus TaxID=2200953 RepID=A0A2U3BEL6_9VIBR|nr:type II secretion system F family protein [Vibrio albus]PWI35220.1 pilus assembly protein TadB [Vibrio albus]
MIMYISLFAGGLLLTLIALLSKTKQHDYLEEYNKTVQVHSMTGDDQAVNFGTLIERSRWQRLMDRKDNLGKQIGRFAAIKVVLFIGVLFFIGLEVNQRFVRGNIYIVMTVVLLAGFYFGYSWLQKRERKRFEEAFPDALNILASAVSSGESIMHAIIYVGNTLDGDVGAEFKSMGQRLQMGDTADEVFKRACKRFPYSSFYFFVITLRANMSRGGQLKDVMTRLNRLMFDARAIDKKKYALTAEARMSAKIVAAIPFVFLILMQYITPDNYEFVMFEPEGRPILYYVLGSEFIGISIIWALMKGVE